MMEQNEILSQMKIMALDIMGRFENVSFRYEFDEKRHLYLVSYYPDQIADNDDRFWKDVLEMSQRMNDMFGVSAPLFSYGEETFKLSEDAKSIVPDKILQSISFSISADEFDFHFDVSDSCFVFEEKYKNFAHAA